MLLQSYPELRTRDRAVIETALKGYNDRIELPAGRVQNEFIANAARFEDIGLFASRYNSANSHSIAPTVTSSSATRSARSARSLLMVR